MPRTWWDRRSRRLSALRQLARLQVESLESRDVPSAGATPDYVLLSQSGSKTPSTSGPAGDGGFTPAEIQEAYGYNQLSFDGTAANGAGTTIAIVDAYSDPTIKTDLEAFDKQFGLPNPVFTVVNQTGGATLPKENPDWATEETLDVEWSHAMAPDANIILVEATSPANANLFAAVQYAASIPGVDVVSMSFGESEFSTETTYDSTVFSPSLNPGVTFVASSGDRGAPVEYPAISPYVLGVGGTSLKLNSSGAYGSESGWTGSSGGISEYESQPSYQEGVVTQSTTQRTDPDVSYDANPYTGMDIYQTYGNASPNAPWQVIGGTSDAAPQWAAIIAITDQGLAQEGGAPLNNETLMPLLYQLPSTDYNTVVGGESTGSPIYHVTPGYNLVSGLGTPVVNQLVPWLLAGPSVTQFAISAPTTALEGNTITITVTAENSAGEAVPDYTGTIDLSSTDPDISGLPATYTFTAADAGSHKFKISFGTLGVQTITATDDSDGITQSVNIDVGSGDTFTVTGFPTLVTAGESGSDLFTVTAYEADGVTEDTGYSGTVEITSPTDPLFQPFDVNVYDGTGTFSGAVFYTEGAQTLTATDTTDSTITGSETGITVTPAGAYQLGFVQEPVDALVGQAISPTVTVAVEDQYGNVILGDDSTSITLTLGTNPTGATLTGGGATTDSNGTAAFGSLSVSATGTGYTLTAAAAGLQSGTSNSFDVEPNPLLENFTNGLGAYTKSGSAARSVSITTAAAHPGTATEGLRDGGDGNWYYRTDAAGLVSPGETISVWIEFPTAATGRAYFGFGSTSKGTDSVVLAPNTNQLLIQTNAGYNSYKDIGAVSQKYSAGGWYLVQVVWGSDGSITANLYASDGVTLLNSVSASQIDTTPGDFGFRATGGVKYFSTVTVSETGTDLILLEEPVSSAGGSGRVQDLASLQGLTSGISLATLPPASSSVKNGKASTSSGIGDVYVVVNPENGWFEELS